MTLKSPKPVPKPAAKRRLIKRARSTQSLLDRLEAERKKRKKKKK